VEEQCSHVPYSRGAGYINFNATEQAAAALGISVRQLKDRADIPRCDIAPPGATRAQWRYLPGDLQAFVAARRIPVTAE
jgi:hypothetical protein